MNELPQATLAGLFATALSLTPLISEAAITAPYQADADTLHLWHMDAGAVPVPDEVSTGGTNLTALGGGATLGNASYSGFGTALSTLDGGQTGGGAAANIDAYLAPRALANNANDNVAWSFADPTTGAFTFEAMLRVDFDPTLNLGPTASGGTGRNQPMQIISGEQDSTGGGTRSWQFRLLPTGYAARTEPGLEFINLANAPTTVVGVSIPTSGDNAIVSNGWYHVAVTYNGNAGEGDNLKIYWTAVNPALEQAAELISVTMNADLPVGAVDFAVGNIGRASPNGNFLGLIDEVRISKVARIANGMLFGPPEVTILTHPTDVTVAVGQPASFRVAVGGAPPFAYQWRTNGVPIPDATNSVYALAAAQFSDALNYDVVITNNVSSITSSPPAVLTVRTPISLTWVGFSDWDTHNINWDTNADSAADTAYIEGDNARFDGQGDSLVFVTPRIRPSSLVVDSASDYTLSTFTGGGFDGNMSLRKAGSGTLVLETVNGYTGPTVIEAGVLQAGSSLGQGTIGSGAVTNNGGLVFGSTAGAVINYLTGTGGLTNNAAGAITLAGTNDLSGALVLNAGSVTISGPAAQGNPSEIILMGANPFTTLNVGGVTYGTGVPLSLLGTTASPDARCQITAVAGTNVFNGPIALEGNGAINISGAAGTEIDLNGDINGSGFTGIVILRGSGTNNAFFRLHNG